MSGFYKTSGHTCKACVKARVKRRALTNPAVQAYDRARAKRPEKKAALAKNSKLWRQQHPEAYHAHIALNNALRDGKIEKGPCAICGATEHIHGHHKDYSKPLEVTWLCAKCHHRIHASFPELGGHAGEARS